MDAAKEICAVLMCDCHNFSIVQKTLGDSTLEFIDALYRTGGECVVSHSGRIVKYIGDAMLAIFPADHADEAVTAARCLRGAYAKLVRTRVLPLGPDAETEMEVGLSYGEVQQGIVGHESLRAFDIMGECVNEAAVICHHRGIAITDAFREQLGSGTEVRPLESRQPKWRRDPLVVWEVAENPIR